MEVITMNQTQKLRRDGRFWMLVAMVTCAVGFFVGLLGLAMVGAGVSGSGCGKACTDSVMSFAYAGSFFLGLALLTALGSMVLIWWLRDPKQPLWVGITVTVLDVLVLLVAGPSLALLLSL